MLFLVFFFGSLISYGQTQINKKAGGVTIQQVNGNVNITNKSYSKTKKSLKGLYKVFSNTRGDFFLDGQLIKTIYAGESCKLELVKGQYKIKMTSNYYSGEVEQEVLLVDDKALGIEHIIDFTFDVSRDLVPINFVPDGKFTYLNCKTKELPISSIYEHAQQFKEGLAVVQLNGKYGYIDCKGVLVVTCKFDEARSFENGLAIVKSGGLFALINKAGINVVPYKYKNIAPFEGGIARVETVESKIGFINELGKEILPANYSFAEKKPFDVRTKVSLGGTRITNLTLSGPIVQSQINAKWGLMDINGAFILSIKYDEILMYDEIWSLGHKLNVSFATRIGNKWTLLDSMGRNFNNEIYDNAVATKNGFLVRKGGKWGYYNYEGVLILPFIYSTIDLILPSYDRIHGNVEFLAVHNYNNKIAVFDLDGYQISHFKYDKIYNTHSFLIEAQIGTKSGYLRREDQGIFGKCIEVTPFIYDHDDYYSEGFGRRIVRNGTKYGLINLYGQTIIQTKYDYISAPGCSRYESGFNDTQSEIYYYPEIYTVRSENKVACFDLFGKQITDFSYDSIEGFDIYCKIGVFQSGDKYGIIDAFGKTIVSAKYDLMKFYIHGIVRAEDKGKYFYYNETGCLTCQIKDAN